MKIQKSIIVLITCLILLVSFEIVLAGVPRQISYQGKATDNSGNPVPDSSYFARFLLYNAPTGGTIVWFEMDFENPSITTKDGYFTHLLGSLNPIPDSVFTKYDSLFLQVMFNFVTISPRIPMVSTGYSLRVNTLDGASGGTIKGSLAIEDSSSSPGIDVAVRGLSGGGNYGVKSYVYSTAGNAYGVYAEGRATMGGYEYGIYATTLGGVTGYAGYFDDNDNPGCYAGYFHGRVAVTGTLSKGGGSFKIDHPLDPTNKYLQHSFVESPDMMNVYNGNTTLDPMGTAVVILPEWFEALNRDFRYQLTAIGAPGPNLYIAQKVSGNQFSIAGGTPGMEVSWQVTGIRQDNWANANRIQVEVDKDSGDRGKYLYPAAYGQPEEMGVDWKHRKPAGDK